MARLILLTDFSEEYAKRLLNGIVAYSNEHSPWVLCKMPLSYRDVNGIEGVLEWALKWEADAIIGQFYPSDNVELFTKHNIIAIAQDFKSRFSSIPNITAEHIKAGEMGAKYFMRKGFRNFGFYGFSGVVWSEERYKGFLNFLCEAGFQNNVYQYINSDSRDLWYNEHDKLAQWLKALPKPVAVMACDDNQGHHISQLCKLHNIKVPQEVAVLGVDNDVAVCSLSAPPLSSINQAVERGGYEVAEMIEMMMRDREYRSEDIYILPTNIVTRQSTDIYATQDKHISTILQYIHNNIGEKLSVEQLSELVPLSRRLLEMNFKEVVGVPVYNYILNLRISKFTERLIDSDDSILEIAEQLGFGDCKNVSRTFKAIKGCTPTQYRLKRKL